LTSGGANNAAVPVAGDDVILDALSGSGTSLFNASLSLNSFDASAFLGTLQFANSVVMTITQNGGTFRLPVGGNVIQASGQSVVFTGTSGTMLLTSNGKQGSALTLNCPGMTVQLQDAYNLVGGNSANLVVTAGTFDANNFNVTTGAFTSNNANVRSILMGSGQWTFNSQGATSVGPLLTPFTNLTFSGASANLYFAPFAAVAGAGAPCQFDLGGGTVNNVTFTGSAAVATQRYYSIGQNFTCNALVFDNSFGGGMNVNASQINSVRWTCNSWTVNAPNSNKPVVIWNNSQHTPGGPIIASGTVTVDNCVLSGVTVSGGATFNATNSVDLGYNTGWNSISPRSGGGGGSHAHASLSGGML
jgi:hypothetical protein